MKTSRKRNFFMEWSTVYIAGKPGFKDEVMRNLYHSRFPSMPGSAENNTLCLFWIDERSTLREFKKAIGSKTVFKYRLQFYSSIESYMLSQPKQDDDLFSEQEIQLMGQMTARNASREVYKQSA
jgi:hypothetical protein